MTTVDLCSLRRYALKADGTILWMFTTGYWINASPALGDDGTAMPRC